MTYEIKTKTAFLELAVAEQDSIIEFLKSAIANDMLVSIQASLVNDNDEEEVCLCGMYDNTVEWVADYNRKGGIWGGMWKYSHPADLLAEFSSI